MKPRLLNLARRAQRGAVSVEAAAVIAFILLPLLAFVVFFGRYFWYYTVAQKAVHDATLYMASAPLADIKSRGAINLAYEIIARETSDFNSTTTVEPTVSCGYKPSPTSTFIVYGNCSSSTTPAAVQGLVMMTISDPFFTYVTLPVIGPGVGILSESRMRYVGH
jgi:Flp pilus assembly protein TadG